MVIKVNGFWIKRRKKYVSLDSKPNTSAILLCALHYDGFDLSYIFSRCLWIVIKFQFAMNSVCRASHWNEYEWAKSHHFLAGAIIIWWQHDIKETSSISNFRIRRPLIFFFCIQILKQPIRILCSPSHNVCLYYGFAKADDLEIWTGQQCSSTLPTQCICKRIILSMWVSIHVEFEWWMVTF